jgi:hypothetical protein
VVGETRTDRFGVFISLTFSGSTRVLSVVSELVRESVGSNGIGVNDGSATTGNHGPDAAFRVEDSQFERGTGRTVEFLDVCLFLGQITTERRGPDL